MYQPIPSLHPATSSPRNQIPKPKYRVIPAWNQTCYPKKRVFPPIETNVNPKQRQSFIDPNISLQKESVLTHSAASLLRANGSRPRSRESENSCTLTHFWEKEGSFVCWFIFHLFILFSPFLLRAKKLTTAISLPHSLT